MEMPVFVLEATDPIGGAMTMMWACFKNGDLAGALNEFNTIAQDHLPTYEENPLPEEHVQAAVGLAEAMEAWAGGEIIEQ